jgi:hypothetical protein
MRASCGCGQTDDAGIADTARDELRETAQAGEGGRQPPKQMAARGGRGQTIRGPKSGPRQELLPRGDTTERPGCDCQTDPEFIYSGTGAPAPKDGFRFRFALSIQSKASCDRGTPGHCEYRYTVKAKFQQQQDPQPPPPRPAAPWTDVDPTKRKAFVQQFRVHDDVNEEWNSDRIDQSEAEVVLWRKNAPNTAPTKVTIVVSPSARGGIKTKLEPTIQLCVPTGVGPKCP